MNTTEHRWVDIPGAPDIPGLRFRFYRRRGRHPCHGRRSQRLQRGQRRDGTVERGDDATEFRSPTHIPPPKGWCSASSVIGSRCTRRSSTPTRLMVSATTAASGNLHPDFARRGPGHGPDGLQRAALPGLAAREAYPGRGSSSPGSTTPTSVASRCAGNVATRRSGSTTT